MCSGNKRLRFPPKVEYCLGRASFYHNVIKLLLYYAVSGFNVKSSLFGRGTEAPRNLRRFPTTSSRVPELYMPTNNYRECSRCLNVEVIRGRLQLRMNACSRREFSFVN